jgi:hypothetical protein
MGIDIWVGSLAQSWLGAAPVVLDLLDDPTPLVFPGEPWSFAEVDAVLRRHPRDDWVRLTPAIEEELRARVERFQQRLRSRLGIRESWDDGAVALEEEVPFENVRQVGGGSLYKMQVVAARLGAAQQAGDPFADMEASPSGDAVFVVTREGAATSFPQLVHLDVNSVFLPIDFPEPLLGLPNRFGSAPRLLGELDVLLEAYGSLPTKARGFDYEAMQLRSAARAAVEKQLPLHVEG